MSSFKFDSGALGKNLQKMSRTELAPLLKLESEAKRLEGYAKTNAPWTDRTGQARRSITTDVYKTDNGYRITLSIGVDYGIWLEFAHERRFAIIMPSIEKMGPEIVDSFQGFMEKLAKS